MDIVKSVKQAFLELVKREDGNLSIVAQKTGVNYATINRFFNGTSNIANIPLATMTKLFPFMEITFFAEDRPKRTPQGGDAKRAGEIPATENHAPTAQPNCPGKLPEPTIEIIRDLVLDCDALSDEAIGQICKILKRGSK